MYWEFILSPEISLRLQNLQAITIRIIFLIIRIIISIFIYVEYKFLSTCKFKVSWKLPEQLDCFIRSAMKTSKTSANGRCTESTEAVRHSLQHTCCSPNCFKRGTLKGQQVADEDKPQDSQSKNRSKKFQSKHRLQRVEKTSLYSSVCTSTTIGWSVCANRKRKESKWKQVTERPELLGAHNWQKTEA